MDELNGNPADAKQRPKNTRTGTNRPTSMNQQKHSNEDTKAKVSAPPRNLKELREKLEKAKVTTANSLPSTIISSLVHQNQQKATFTLLCSDLLTLAKKYTSTHNPTLIFEISSIIPLIHSPTLLLFPHPLIPLTLPQAQQITLELQTFRPALSKAVDPEMVLLLKKGLLLCRRKLGYSSLEWFLTWPFHKLGEGLGDEEVAERVANMLGNRAYAMELAYEGDQEVRGRMVEYVFGDYVSGEKCCNGFRRLRNEEVLEVFRGKFEEVRRELGAVCGCVDCRDMLGGEGK